MYLFLSNKNPQEQSLLWERIKEQETSKNTDLIDSLTRYILESGKKNFEERIAVSTLLFSALEYLKNNGVVEKIGVLKKTQLGRPYLDGGDADISISHTKDYVLVGISADTEIGVDIEREIYEGRAKNLEKRFFDGIDFSCRLKDESCREDMHCFEFSQGKFSQLALFPTEGGFTSKWTLAEAVMKCDGSGFSSLQSISQLSEAMVLGSYIVNKNGKNIYISVAEKNKKER